MQENLECRARLRQAGDFCRVEFQRQPWARVAGGIAAFAGLLGPPVVIVTILAALYARFGEIEVLRHILAGVSCAAVGLLMSVVFRMMMPLLRKREPVSLVALSAVFIAVGLLRLPLPAVLGVAMPLSIAITFVLRRKVHA